jgi:cytochrome c-type biogenesis protein CcmE
MKGKTLFGLVLMVGFTALLFMNFGDQVGGYMHFAEAEEVGTRAHVVGQWVESKKYRYDQNQNLFSFHMKDDQGRIEQVVYPDPKPANFEDAEKLVIEGEMQDGVFVADHILVKCPSKYNDQREFETTSTSGGPTGRPTSQR